MDGALGPPLSVGIGVKQGCPLSPKLFNAYLADLGVHLKHVLPDAGPVLPGVEGRNPDFEYADDVFLLECQQSSRMQPLANATSEFCTAHFMTIKAAKSVCIVLGADAGRFGYNIQVNGEVVRQAGPQGVVCLGLLFDSSASDCVMFSRRSACFVSAFHGIVSASVPYLCMLHDFGCVPLVHAYVLRAVRFYNSLVLGAQGGVYCAVLQQNIADVRRGRSPVQNWFFHLCAVLRLIRPTGRWLSDVRNLQQLNIKQVKRALLDAYDKYTASLRTVHEGEGSRIGFYFREMAGISWYLLHADLHYVTACMRVVDRCYQHGDADVPVVRDSRAVALPDDVYDDLLRPYQPDMFDSSVSSAPHDESDERDDAVSAPA
eukprot:jgi/Chrzof1/5233/Cz15g18060.t1